MTTVALKRGAPPKRRSTRPVVKPLPRMVRVPVAPSRLRWQVAASFAGLLVVGGLLTLWLTGVPQRWWQETAQAAARAGFEVRHVEVSGTEHSSKLGIYAAAFEGASNSMLLVDLGAVRTRLQALPWVADASVTRRLPDTLVVRITERAPVALWQYHHRLYAIDRTGALLTSQRLERFTKLPLLVGAGANGEAHRMLTLLGRYPRVADAVDAATLVGQRRWDLRFRTGETLALPEGALPAATALAKFEALDAKTGLLGKGFARFDMRLPGRMMVRIGTAVPRAKDQGVTI